MVTRISYSSRRCGMTQKLSRYQGVHNTIRGENQSLCDDVQAALRVGVGGVGDGGGQFPSRCIPVLSSKQQHLHLRPR